MGKSTEIKTVPTNKLKPAPWNYKIEGAATLKEKLKKSIQEDGSAGVLAVRQLGKGFYEVIDGNHRLDAVIEAGWQEVTVEDFGKISETEAMSISIRRNKEWFDTDIGLLADRAKTLFKSITPADFSKYAPYTEKELVALDKVANWDIEAMEEEFKQKPRQGITITLKEKLLVEMWMATFDELMKAGQVTNYEEAVGYLLKEREALQEK